MKKTIFLLTCLFAIAQAHAATKTLTAVTTLVLRTIGQECIVLGFSDGSIELRDWKGKLISSRTGLGKITALESYRDGSSPLPRLYIGSTISSGTVRIVDPASLSSDMEKRTGLGEPHSIWSWGEWIYVGTGAGKIWRLDGDDLSTLKSRSGFGDIKYIRDGVAGGVDYLVISSTNSSGSFYVLNAETLATVGSKASLGTIYGFDVEESAYTENNCVYLTCSSSSGSLRIYELGTLNLVSSKTSIGSSTCLAPGYIGDSEDMVIGVGTSAGKITLWNWDGTTISQGKTQTVTGSIFDMGIEDTYLHDVDVLNIIRTYSTSIYWYTKNENLSTLSSGSCKP